jgi:hypothetical protein
MGVLLIPALFERNFRERDHRGVIVSVISAAAVSSLYDRRRLNETPVGL